VDGFSGIVGPGFNTVDRDVRLVTVLQHYALSDCSKEQFVHHPITSPIQAGLAPRASSQRSVAAVRPASWCSGERSENLEQVTLGRVSVTNLISDRESYS
jgi:hypothetical protein